MPAPFVADSERETTKAQLSHLKAAVRANNSLKFVDLQSRLPADSAAGLTSIGASTNQLGSERDESLFKLNPQTEEIAKEGADDSYCQTPAGGDDNQIEQRRQRKSLVLSKPATVLSSKVFQSSPNKEDSQQVGSSSQVSSS